MGFSGGGGGQLLNHEHDGSVPLDGGPLSFLGITQSGMSDGSITYSNTAHLRELSVGSVGEKLTVSAGNIPEWSPSMTSLTTQSSTQSGLFSTASGTFVAVGNGLQLILPTRAGGKALVCCNYTIGNTVANSNYVALFDDGVTTGVYQTFYGSLDVPGCITGIFDLDGSVIELYARTSGGLLKIIQSPGNVAGSICALQIA